MTPHESLRTVAVLGTLPPIRALSSYCYSFSHAIADHFQIDFISFKQIYPRFLYPGRDLTDDHTYPEIIHPHVRVKRRLAWYNPLSWVQEGLSGKADLLHAQWWSLPLFPVFWTICRLFRSRGKRIIFTVHNVLPHEPSKLFVKLSHLLFKMGDHFIVHSQKSCEQMMSQYRIPRDHITIIPHGSLDFHRKKDVNPSALRDEIGLGRKNKVILLFGAIRPYKGVDIALKAMPEIIRHVPEARLLIAGKLWEDWAPYDYLIKHLGISDFVHLHLEYIFSDQVYKYFESADLAILPYRHFDSQSGAGATAVAFRKPVVVANVGGLPELTVSAESVFEPNDPKGLADAVVKCLTDSDFHSRLASNYEKISRQLDWDAIARQTASVYEKTLRNSCV